MGVAHHLIIVFLCIPAANGAGGVEDACSTDGLPCSSVSLLQAQTLLSRTQSENSKEDPATLATDDPAQSQSGWDMGAVLGMDMMTGKHLTTVSDIVKKLKEEGRPKQWERVSDSQFNQAISTLTDISNGKFPEGVQESDVYQLIPAMSVNMTVDKAIEVARDLQSGSLGQNLHFQDVMNKALQSGGTMTFDDVNGSMAVYDTAMNPATTWEELELLMPKVLDLPMYTDPMKKNTLEKVSLDVKAGKSDVSMLRFMLLALQSMSVTEAKTAKFKIETGEDSMKHYEDQVHAAQGRGIPWFMLVHEHDKRKGGEKKEGEKRQFSVPVILGIISVPTVLIGCGLCVIGKPKNSNK